MSVMDKITEIDHMLFTKINGDWHSPFFDTVLSFSRQPQLWIPFYFFLILFTTINFKKSGLFWVVAFAVTAIFSDYLSSTVIKYAVMRLRPCQDPSMADHLRLLVSGCPGNPSFTSSHAVNHFCAAMFIFTTFKYKISKWWALLFAWAAIISYAQVYVGVHFPADVLCGGILGSLIGYFSGRIFNNKLGLQYPEISN